MKRFRQRIKAALIAGYCQHLIPAWGVSAAFWALRLRSL